MKISSLDDIQKLEAKDLREILKYNLKLTVSVESLCFADVTRPSIK